MSVDLNNTVPLGFLKKKHNAIAHNRVREAVKSWIMKFTSIKSR
jgi:hypothetical protein